MRASAIFQRGNALALWRICVHWLVNLVRITTLLWLVGHFALTVAYVMPINPIQIALQPLLDATVGTYFQQNWRLFAPEPLSSNYALLARPLTAAELASIPMKGLPSDGWYDLTLPLIEKFQFNRFSAYDRLTRPQTNAILQYLGNSTELEPWALSCQKGNAASCVFYENQLKISRTEAERLLAKVGSAFCRDLTSCQNATSIALRVREIDSVPWSERYTGVPSVQITEIGVYPIDRTVARPNLYLGDRSQ